MLRYLTNHRVYDEELYSNFVDQISERLLNCSNREQFEEYVRALCFSQEPLSNQPQDHFNDLLEVLDFYQ